MTTQPNPSPVLTEPQPLTAWVIYSSYFGSAMVPVYKSINGMLPYFATKAAAERYRKANLKRSRVVRYAALRVKVTEVLG